ncbi:hypothetical protein GCM10023169_33220 [Georgenia halophila]|uniref:ABC transporter permease n=1 Tax=Georgenia halophila TaxID=620889 RepID=A0ABP8LI41_9MICO
MSTRDDRSDAGPEDAQTRTPDDAGTETVDAGTETVDAGTETVEVDIVDSDSAGADETAPERESYGVPELDDEDDEDDYDDEVDETTPSETIARVLNLAIGLVVAVFVALLAVVAPTAGSAPSDVPIGMVGPEQTVTQLRDVLGQARPGAYDVQTFDNAEALRAATQEREVYGGFVLNQDAPALFVASGASPEQAQFLQSLGSQLGLTNVTDVAETTSEDPDAVGITATVVILGLVALAGAVGLRMQLRGRVRAQALGAVALAVVVGLACSGALHGLGSVTGAFWSLAGSVGLGFLATTLVAVGLINLAGMAGAAIVLLLIVLPGIGLAGLWTVPEAIPSIWGTVGQYLPAGATGTMMKATAYFGGGALEPALILLGWTVLGVLLVLLGGLRARRAAARTAALEAALAAEAEADEDDDEGEDAVDDEEHVTTTTTATASADSADRDDEDGHDDEADAAKVPEASDGDTVDAMSEQNDPHPTQSDWLREGGAEADSRPQTSEDDRTGEALSPSEDVHGTEGGGDPAAGAEEDSSGGTDKGHRSPRQV